MRTDSRTSRWDGVRAAFPGWLSARVVVLAAYFVTRAATNAHAITEGGQRVHVPLVPVIGDGAWYRDIARHGYRALPREAVRFFPLLPALTRAVHGFGLPVDWSLLVVTNLAAL